MYIACLACVHLSMQVHYKNDIVYICLTFFTFAEIVPDKPSISALLGSLIYWHYTSKIIIIIIIIINYAQK